MPERIIVVGGGFTGLTAARALALGRDPPALTLIEASPSLGGLAGGFPLCGTSLEKSYHYLLMGDTDVLALIRELGLNERLFWRPGSVGIHDGRQLHPFGTALDLLRFTPLPPPDRIRLGLAMWRLQRTRDWQALVGQTARDWLLKACGPAAMEAIWNPLLRGKFDRYWDQVSMAWLWARVHTRANSRSGGRERLGYLRGGFAAIVNGLEAELRRSGVAIRTGTRVERMALSPARRLHLSTGEALDFDRCLFTGPADALARLLPADPALADYRQQLSGVNYLGAICLILVTDQALCPQHWVNIHAPDSPFLVLVNHTALTGTDLYQGRHVYYLGCYRPDDSPWFGMDDEPLVAAWFATLQRLFPAFDAARVQERQVFRFRRAQHVVDCGYAQRIPAVRTPVPGLYLSNFAQIFPYDRGTNFAVRDGLKLADLVAADRRAGLDQASGR